MRKFLILTPYIYLFTFLIFFWFLTKSWLPIGSTLVGHDSGLALDTKEFLQTRFYSWDQQSFGGDNSTHFGSIVLHGFDYILSLIAGVPYAGNHVVVFFWLSAIFTAGLIFAYSLKDKLGYTFQFFFPVFVTFNFFIFQSIFILERAKYAVFIALLLFLTIAFKVLDNKIPILLAAIISSFIFFIFNSGSWLGLPLYASAVVSAVTMLVVFSLDGLMIKNFSKLRKLLSLYFLTLIGVILLDSYSIWPYFVSFITRDYKALLDTGVITSNKAWLDSMSQSTSFINIFRLQGIPDWYTGLSAPNLGHAYAGLYLTNPFLIIISFVFPVLIFLSLLLSKRKEEKKIVFLFFMLVLISMIFMAGSHPPLGFLYELLYEFVPGFSIFRSPYYKFGSAFILATSVLLAFSLSSLIRLLSNRFTTPIYKFSISAFLVVFCITSWFAYHFVLLDSNKIFSWQKDLTTKANPPAYIYEFRDWSLRENNENKRIVLLPPLNPDWQNDGYKWGYWSLSTLPSVLTSRPIVTNDRLLVNEETGWVNKLYQKIREGNEKEILTIARKLNIGYFLIRNDVADDVSWSAADSSSIYQSILSNFSLIKKIKSFGDWDVYKIDDSFPGKIFAVDSLTIAPEGHAYMGPEFLKNEYMYLVDNKEEPKILERFFSKKLEVYECQSCFLEQPEYLTSLPEAKILPDSLLYQFKLMKERSIISKSETNKSKADAYLGFTLVKTGEIKAMIDFGRDEKYVIQNLEVMNEYLENYYELLQTFLSPSTDYYNAKHLSDIINPIEKYLRSYVSGHEFGKQSEKFRKEMLNVLWNIYKIKNYSLSLYEDKELLGKEKVYYTNFKESGDYKLFIHINSLSISKDGKPNLPSSVEYFKGEKAEPLKLVKENGDWIEMKLPIQEVGESQIRFKFDDLPNKYVNMGSELRQSPTGIRACYYGKISSFRKGKNYIVKVKISKQGQSLRMFFQESAFTRSKNGFIRGEDEVDIFVSDDEQFYHFYRPSGYATESLIYICSGNKKLPVIEQITINEIFSPLVVSTKDIAKLPSEIPTVMFTQTNSTKYSVKIENAKDPFILYFNERFSPFWKLSGSDTHFMVDGYANAWIVDKNGSFEMNLEYSLQKYFYAGGVMTAFSSISMLTVLIYLLRRRRNV